MYAGGDFRASDRYRSGGQLGAYGIALAPVVSAVISSLNPFSSSGPDKDSWNKRARRISLAIDKANAGDIKAWYLLGAMARPAVPLPIALGLPYIGTPVKPGWTANDWGTAYNPLRAQARDAYVSLAPMFQKTGGPVLIPTTPGAPLPAPAPVPTTTVPYPDPGNNLPTYAPDPTQGAIPAPMQPLQEATVFGIPKNLALPLAGLALVAVLANRPRSNPGRRRNTRRRRRSHR